LDPEIVTVPGPGNEREIFPERVFVPANTTLPAPGTVIVCEPLAAMALEKVNLLVDWLTVMAGLLPAKVMVPPERKREDMYVFVTLTPLAHTPELVTAKFPPVNVITAVFVAPFTLSHGVRTAL
jgi:hypothetical protein